MKNLQVAIPYLVAAVSSTAFIVIWFSVVRRELYAKQNMVEAAEHQLTASQEQLVSARDGPEKAKAQGILKRSNSVYRQAVGIYNKTLRRPRNVVPAFFLGYRKKYDGNEKKLY